MRYNRIFLDTAFVQALLNKKDEFHEKAKSLAHHLREAEEVWITEAVPEKTASLPPSVPSQKVIIPFPNIFLAKD